MIAIINYDMGNITSVENALLRLNAEACITDEANKIESADKIILPGVGAFGDGMKNLKRKKLVSVLEKQVLEKKKPILGICLGMQLMCTESFEFGVHNGLGWFDGSVMLLDAKNGLRVPHIGWNSIMAQKANPLMLNEKPQDFYFVHSYRVVCKDEKDVLATCEYGNIFTAAISKNNLFGVQFHPEKSQNVGMELLAKFIAL